MRYYSKRRPQNIIIPIYPAAVFAGDQVTKLGDIKYVYYQTANSYVQVPGVYAESSGGTISCQAGQAILTITTDNSSVYVLTLSYDASIGQTIETTQGNYYFVIPDFRAFVALEDGTIIATLYDSRSDETIAPAATSVLYKSMYGINVQTE